MPHQNGDRGESHRRGDSRLRLLEAGGEGGVGVDQRQVRRVRAVVARQRIEENRHRLQHEDVEIGGGDEQPPAARVEPAARKREQRVDEHGEDDVRGDDAGGVGGGTVGVVQHADQRREADGRQEQAKAQVGPQPHRGDARAHERQAHERRQERLDGRVRRDPAHREHPDGCGRGAGRRQEQRDRERPYGRRRVEDAAPRLLDRLPALSVQENPSRIRYSPLERSEVR